MHLEVITELPKTKTVSTPLLFMHGGLYGAWCWEHFLPFFAENGYEAQALGLRGHGRAPVMNAFAGSTLPNTWRTWLRRPASCLAVFIGHSMGGYVIKKENPASYFGFDIPPRRSAAS